MMAASPISATYDKPCADDAPILRRSAQSKEPDIFNAIYQQDINMVIWQRELSASLQNAVKDFLASNPPAQMEVTVTPQSALSSMSETLGMMNQPALSANIAELVGMFCSVFELKRAKLSLKVLDQAMCPKFHVDRIPCRLLTTYQGVATEWLPHHVVDRTKLGRGSHGQSDEQSGLFQSPNDIQQLNCGDVALLKGELWQGNQNAGLVHRSPVLPSSERRLLLKLDFIN